MNIFIYSSNESNIDQQPFEVVETKGKGHPDNICDALAEKISANYSKYCLENFGIVLRHMIDKLSILGGGSHVEFGGGKMTAPIRVLINGRFTNKFADQTIDYMDIVQRTIKTYFHELFPLLDAERFLTIIDNTHVNEGPGVVFLKNGTTKNERKSFFTAIDETKAQEHANKMRTNDTSTTVGYYPLSCLENTVLDIERTLNSEAYKAKYPYVGSDIKVMGVRKDKVIEITACVPLISKFVNDYRDYQDKLAIVNSDIEKIIQKHFPNNYSIKIFLNTRDSEQTNDLYMTLIGSAVESGDEGAVGRGNRSNGVIAFTRNMSMEAASGKNPIYHTGKLFTAIGNVIAKQIYESTGLECTVFMTSRMGDAIIEPWSVAIKLYAQPSSHEREVITKIVENCIDNHQQISLDIINGVNRVNNY